MFKAFLPSINKKAFVFLLFFGISIFIVIKSHVYHHNLFISSANNISGSLFKIKNAVARYIDLDYYNEILINENVYLREEIFSHSLSHKELPSPLKNYNVTKSNVVKNSYVVYNNYIIVEKGINNGIDIDMGVISPSGIIGITENVSSNYTRVQSILHSKSRINASPKETNFFGVITWDGNNEQVVQLSDIPKVCKVQKGDTIVTSGMSYIFPKNILIGTVLDYSRSVENNYYRINVNLFTDMKKIGPVYIIKNKHQNELKELETK